MSQQLTAPSEGQTRSPRVLIIEENEVLNKLISTVLAEEAHYVTACTSEADEALQLVSSQSFDLILLSATLSPMNGFELYDRLRMLPGNKHVPVLLTSTLLYQQTNEVSKRHLPALEKPFDLDELLARVAQLLE